MTILDLLKNPVAEMDVRLTCGDKWLCFDNFSGEWVVYQRKYRAKQTTETRFKREQDAVRELVK